MPAIEGDISRVFARFDTFSRVMSNFDPLGIVAMTEPTVRTGVKLAAARAPAEKLVQ
jgi:hypothetical protein